VRAGTGSLFALALAGSVSAAAAEIRVVGCDLLGPDFAAALRAHAQRCEVDLTLALEGSHGGRARFEAGAADLALLVLRPEEMPPAPPHRGVPLGYFTTIVLVPAASPLTEISLGELAGIFGADTPADHSRWGDLGLGGEWTARAIGPQALAPEAGLSSALFRHHALGGGVFKTVVDRPESTAALMRKLAADPGGIALAGAAPRPDEGGANVLRVSRGDADVAFGPTPENVHAGDYPLRLTLWLAVRREFADAGGLDLVRFLLGDESARQLERAQVLPLTRPVREQLRFETESWGAAAKDAENILVK